MINLLAGGRLFAGEHNSARSEVHETPKDLRVALSCSATISAITRR
jgi:hypothetical protein